MSVEDNKNMTVKDLIEKLQVIIKSNFCDDGETMCRHRYKTKVNFVQETEDKLIYFDLEEIQIDTFSGCYCESGITFKLKKRE